jgi:hypothetical protein
MILSPMDYEKLRNAMLEAYPTKIDLEIIVSDRLDSHLDEIAGGQNLREIISYLI